MEIKDYLDLTQIDSNALKAIDLYEKTKNIYRRTKSAINQASSIRVTISSTKEITVSNGAQSSTKVYTGK